MSGIIDSVGSKSGIVGSDVYPAGHVVFVDQETLAGSSSQLKTFSGDFGTWFDSGLEISVSSANAAKGSKILIHYSHAFGISNGTASGQMHWKLYRTVPSGVSLEAKTYIGQQSTTAGVARITATGSVIDESLGSDIHTYKLQYTSSSAGEASAIYYNWYASSINTIIAQVIV
jgi:hypothetical protein